MANQINKNSKTTNVSKEKREELLERITEIKAFIEKSADDENRKNLLKYIADLEKDVGAKKYGLVFEEHREEIDSKLEENTPVLTEEEKLFIDKGGEINFLIEGDNLASLRLLEKTHRGKIDLIYIDPPYNTGNKDFVYGDSFVDQNDTFRHSKWLSFMAKRLPIAKRLLSEKGVIFISIDDNEQAQLKILCDEVFGENNFVSLYPRLTVKGGKIQTNLSTKNNDYVFAYAKDINQVVFNKITISDDPAFKYQDEYLETRGKFHTKQALDTVSLGYVPSLDYPIEHEGITYYPGGEKSNNGYRWTWSKDKYEFALKNDFVVFKNGRVFPKKYSQASIEKNENGYYIKYADKAKNYSQLQFIDNVYSNTNGTINLQDLKINFSYAKPVSLIKDLLTMATSNSATVLDFFAGSGTTGHAVLKLNAEDGGNRRFILCTNNENNICRDVTYERIKRVIEKEDYKASLKYFRVDFVPITEKLFFEYADELLKHVKELVELENGINFTGNSRLAIVLTEKELDDFASSLKKNTKCEAVYLSHDILLNTEQKQIFKDKGVKINIIPDYYYRELAE